MWEAKFGDNPLRGTLVNLKTLCYIDENGVKTVKSSEKHNYSPKFA